MPFQSGSTMYNQNYIRIEAQPLASYADGSDDELASSEKDTEAFATRGLTSTKSRRLQFALALAFIFVTNSLSGAVGAYLKWRSMKWDSECALHTTQYCKSCLFPGRGKMYTVYLCETDSLKPLLLET